MFKNIKNKKWKFQLQTQCKQLQTEKLFLLKINIKIYILGKKIFVFNATSFSFSKEGTPGEEKKKKRRGEKGEQWKKAELRARKRLPNKKPEWLFMQWTKRKKKERNAKKVSRSNIVWTRL